MGISSEAKKYSTCASLDEEMIVTAKRSFALNIGFGSNHGQEIICHLVVSNTGTSVNYLPAENESVF